MAKCEFLQTCPFFNDVMANMPTSAMMMKEKYCEKGLEQCARFTIAKTLGKLAVPADLFPHQKDRAKDIIKGNTKP